MAIIESVPTRKKKNIIDITDRVEKLLGGSVKSKTGLCHVFTLHTTAAVTTADLDPGTDLDMLDAFEKMVPKLNYRHPHNPAHVPDHIMSSIIGPGVFVPVNDGKLVLGTWQRIILIELDGPRDRQIAVSFIKSEI
jgi:secondary thiamine-phosphate synthase enzyme